MLQRAHGAKSELAFGWDGWKGQDKEGRQPWDVVGNGHCFVNRGNSITRALGRGRAWQAEIRPTEFGQHHCWARRWDGIPEVPGPLRIEAAGAGATTSLD